MKKDHPPFQEKEVSLVEFQLEVSAPAHGQPGTNTEVTLTGAILRFVLLQISTIE